MIVNVYDLGEIGTDAWRKRLHDEIARIAYTIPSTFKRFVFYEGDGRVKFSSLYDYRVKTTIYTLGEVYGERIMTRWYFIRKAWKEGRYMDIIYRIERELEKEKKVVA